MLWQRPNAPHREALCTSVTEHVDVADCGLGPEVGELLGKYLRKSTLAWKSLNLEDNELGREGANPIFWALRRNCSLYSLDLSRNGLGEDFGTAEDELADDDANYGTSLTAALEMNFTLQWLDLGNNGLSAECGINFASALRENPAIMCLCMEGNGLDHEAGYAIADKLGGGGRRAGPDTQVKFMNLARNAIGWQGGIPLAESLELNRTLTHLDLAANGLGHCGPVTGRAFAAAICVNTVLRHLNLRDNRLGPDAAAAIAEALTKNNTLRVLDVFDNRLDDVAGLAYYRALVDGPRLNKTLLSLDISEVEIGRDHHVDLKKELRKRKGEDEPEPDMSQQIF